VGYQRRCGCVLVEWVVRTTLDVSGRLLGLAVEGFLGWAPSSERASSSVVIVGGG